MSGERRREFGAAHAIRRRTTEPAQNPDHPDRRVLPILGENWREPRRSPERRYLRFRTPGRALTVKYRAKPVRKTNGGALAIMNFC
jgi:hypothetical protein